MSARKKSFRRALGAGFWLLVLGACWVFIRMQPTTPGKPIYVRYGKTMPVREVLADLEHKGVIRDANVFYLLAAIRIRRHIPAGTYQVHPGSDMLEICRAFDKPISQKVRIPEENWAARTANLLAEKEVCDADAYLDAVSHPERFKKSVAYPLPKGSLEGYLYPDTYDLPPLAGAETVVKRQLGAFGKRVWPIEKGSKDVRRDLTLASIVELETKRDDERRLVAGVLENRLKAGMPLQVDATVLYARQKWGELSRSELTSVESPYNTYLHKGLPPGPICSPSVKSVEAARNPARHKYLYYVAMPDGTQRFAATLAEHERNIAARKAALEKGEK